MENQTQPARIVAAVATTSQLSLDFTTTQLEVLQEVADSMTDTPSVGQRFLSPAQLQAAQELVAAGWLVRVKPGRFVRYEISPAGQPGLAPVLQALSQPLAADATPVPTPHHSDWPATLQAAWYKQLPTELRHLVNAIQEPTLQGCQLMAQEMLACFENPRHSLWELQYSTDESEQRQAGYIKLSLNIWLKNWGPDALPQVVPAVGEMDSYLEAVLGRAQDVLGLTVARASLTGERTSHPDGVIDITTPVGQAWAARNDARDALDNREFDKQLAQALAPQGRTKLEKLMALLEAGQGTLADEREAARLIERNLDKACGGRKHWRKHLAQLELERRGTQPKADRATAANEFSTLWEFKASHPDRPDLAKEVASSSLWLLKFLRTSHETSSWALPAQGPLLLLLLFLGLASSSCARLTTTYQARQQELASPSRTPAADSLALAPPN